MSKASTAMAAVSPLPDGKDLWLVSIEVGLCDTGSPECRMVCHQSGGYQDRRFKKGGKPSGQLRKVTAICRPEGLKEVGGPLKII